MAGQKEYTFWHLLVRDVAYSQIPRASRASKHLRAATWLEQKAGERVEDLAEVLAHHTGEALELARATGDADLARELMPRARRYALLAGERALGLDASKALHLLGQALTLTPEEDTEYPFVLARWGQAALQAGNSSEAARALGQAVDTFQLVGDIKAAAQTLVRLSEVIQHLGEPGLVPMAEEAVALAETLEPTPVLVDALSRLAGIRWREGNLDAAIGTADRAIATAVALQLPPPGRALGYRGLARCDLGDIGGVTDIEDALARLTGDGHGYDAGTLRSNLGYVRWLFEGPVAAVEEFEKAGQFATHRGLIPIAEVAAASALSALVETGRLDESLVRAEALLLALEASGSAWCKTEATANLERVLAERGAGDVETAGEALAEARLSEFHDHFIVATVPTALSRIAAGQLAEARALLHELSDLSQIREAGEYGPRLPSLVRCALAAGDPGLAARLAEGVDATLPVRALASCTAQALLAEARGDHQVAAESFADAAARWNGFGAGLEHAYALLGQGRCLAALRDPAADTTLRRARELFQQMGARPRIDECDSLIGQTAAVSS